MLGILNFILGILDFYQKVLGILEFNPRNSRFYFRNSRF